MADLKWIEAPTCLSPHVHYLLSATGVSSEVTDVLLESGTLHWSLLKSSVCSNGSDFEDNKASVVPKTESRSQVYFSEVVCHLAPMFSHVENVYRRIPKEKFSADHLKNLLWTHNEKIFLRCYELLQSKGTDVILAILLMTAAIERSLGNVYLLKGKQVPSLLKDLLMTSELQQVFGILPIKVLQVMIGPPSSLNLRNLVWHGFVMPHEMQKCYGYFLLILVLSLGEQLSKNSVTAEDIPKRENISFCETKAFDNAFPDITEKDIPAIKQVVASSCIILPGFKEYWEASLLKYCQGEYGDCLVLVLPQLENSLRIIYATVNCCPERVLTAEMTTLYTTFEKILCLEDSNKVPAVLGENYMEILQDLLVYPEGPRIRDRISHGEVDLHKLPRHLAKHVLNISVAILCRFLPQHLLPESEYIQKVQQHANSYWPFFHPKSLLKSKSIKFLESLIAWQTYPHPEEINEMEENFSNSLNDVSQSVKLFCHYLNMENIFWSVDHGFDINKMLSNIQNSFPRAAYESKYEKEVINLLRHITSHAFSSSEQIRITLSSRYKQWTEKQLRSRQRVNYLRLLKSVPCIYEGLTFVGVVVIGCFLYLRSLLVVSIEFQKTTKLLKIILQYVENLKTLTSAERNRWEESCELTTNIFSNFIQLVNTFNRTEQVCQVQNKF